MLIGAAVGAPGGIVTALIGGLLGSYIRTENLY
jgi:hypothetical protein